MNEEIVVLFVSIDNYVSALHISRIITNEKLCACSTILQNTTSVYEWKNKIEERSENLMIIKTTKNQIQQLILRIKELHPDEVPEIIAIPVIDGLPEYFSWLKSVVQRPTS